MKLIPKKLISKFLLLFLIFSLISSSIFVYTFSSIMKPIAQKQANFDITVTAKNIALQLKIELAKAETLAFALAKVGENLSGSPQKDKALLKSLLSLSENNTRIAGGGVWPEPYAYDKQKRFASFFWAKDIKEKFEFYNDYNEEGSVSYHNEQWYVPSKYTNASRAFWSNSYIDPYSKEPMVTVTVPMYKDKTFIGVSTVDVKLKGLDDLLFKQVKGFNGYAVLVDSGGKFLSHPDKMHAKINHEYLTSLEYTSSISSFQPINHYIETSLQKVSESSTNTSLRIKLLQEISSISKRDIYILSNLISKTLKEDMRVDYIYNIQASYFKEPADSIILNFPQTNWKLIIYIPHSYIYANTKEVLNTLLLTFSAIFVLLILFATYLLRNLLIHPIARLRNEIQAISNHNNPLQYLSIIGEDELSELAKNVNTHSKLLYDSKDVLSSALKIKSDFLANMSHEIRTPMNAIIGFINILHKSETDQKKLEQLKIIKDSGDSLLEIINDILDFSKIESKQLKIDNSVFQTREPLERIYELCSTKAQDKSINMHITMQEDLPLYATGDVYRIKQILTNLVSNAIKFTPHKGEIHIQASLYNKNKLKIEVIDNGIGIESKNFSRVFNSFEQEDLSTTRKFGGTGLGLSIASKLSELMSGSIHLESTHGKGSNFYFILPIFEAEILQSDIPQEEKEPETQIFKGHILIVEDNKTNQILLKMLLEDRGLTSEAANDGILGIKAYAEGDFDLILMDENMPNMNGIQATKSIKNLSKYKTKSIPIIAVTANALNGDKEKFLDAGLDDYMAKPIMEEELDRILDKYLNT